MYKKEIKQHDKRDCGAACLATICNYFGIYTTLVEARELAFVDKMGVSVYGITQAAEKKGLKAEALEGTLDELIQSINNAEIQLPAIAYTITQGNMGHYVIIKKICKKYIYTFDPAKGRCKKRREEFNTIWAGVIVAFSKIDKEKKTQKKRKKSTEIYLKIMRSGRREFFATFLLSFLIAVIAMLGAGAYRVVIDQYILGGNKESTGVMINQNNSFVLDLELIVNNFKLLFLILVGLYTFQVAILFIRGQILNCMAKKMNNKLSIKFFEHLLYLPVNFFERRETGEILTRYQSIMDLQQLLVNALLTVILESAMAIAGGVILVQISIRLFFLVVLIVVLYAVVTITLIKPLKKCMRKTKDNDADITTYLNESIDGIQRIKADVIEEKFLNNFFKKVCELSENIFKLSSWQNAITLVVVGIENIGILLILWQGSIMVMRNIISLGTLITFETLVQFFITPIKNLINVQATIHNLFITVNRLNDVLDVKREQYGESKEPFHFKEHYDLLLRNVRFSYGYKKAIISNFNVCIFQNEKVGIVGRSGSGKSTLLKLIATLERKNEGEIFYGGTELEKINVHFLRKKIAYVSQDTYLFTGTLLDNLLPWKEEIEDDYRNKIFQTCGIEELINSLPDGYQTNIDENGNNLSGGQKQKISLARALLKKPQILLLDEPTSNIDKVSENKILQFITKELQDTTVIFVFHNLERAKEFNKIIYLDEGIILGIGSHNELILKNNRYKSFFDQKEEKS